MGLERLMWRENSCGEASANVNSLERLTAMWNPKTTVDGVGGGKRSYGCGVRGLSS